ncbi:MAG: stage II sporulation protein P [Peptococcaceae bacterium]|nr:stage II sporulation protein P [Peptococcaceae bacterium]
MAVFIFFLYFNITHDSSARYLIGLLSEKSIPLEMVLLEGAPGLSQPQREYINQVRYSAAGLGMYLLTGVNISDPRTYFLAFYAPPKEGLPWIGWTYHPNDPEMEGSILEPLDNPFYSEPAPVTSEHDVLVGVYHTHNAESYAGDGGKDRVNGGENGNVVELGKLLVDVMNKNGIPAYHSATVNDKIYINAYDYSYQTAKKILQEHPTIRLLLDVHRDGLPTQVGKSSVTINNKETAKVMIVIGQKNPNWEKNNQIANKILAIGEEKYPGLFFPKIRYASEARYNQHLTNGALLFEIGSQLNTPEEAKAAVEPLVQVLKAYLQK